MSIRYELIKVNKRASLLLVQELWNCCLITKKVGCHDAAHSWINSKYNIFASYMKILHKLVTAD